MSETENFRDSYEVLQRHAETLRKETEPNIDDLLKIVTESVAAYTVCKRRIDAVEEALKAALAGSGVLSAASEPIAASRPPAPGVRPAPSVRPAPARAPSPTPSGFDDMDDDIPF